MAIENLLDYTEEDPNSRITVTSARSSWAGLTRNEDAYVYKDKDAGHFSGDFEHLLDVRITSSEALANVVAWSLTNIVDDLKGIKDANGDALGISLQTNGGGAHSILLMELVGGTFYTDAYAVSLNTTYYLKIKRDESIGDYGRLYCYIYSDSDRTNLLDTLQLDLHEKEDFRYIFITQTSNAYWDYAQTAWAENLDLQEVTAKSASDSGSGADQSSLAVTLEKSDSGVGAEAVALAVALLKTDAGVGAEASLLVIPVAASDAGVGVDLSALIATLTSSDSGVGADTVRSRIQQPFRVETAVRNLAAIRTLPPVR